MYFSNRLSWLRATKGAAAICLVFLAGSAGADSPTPGGLNVTYKDGEVHAAPRADGHGPIGVMGDHRHHTGELMLSYRFMRMWMEGNRIGDDDVSPETIVTTVPNPFFGNPGQPPTLRVVPKDMSMDMHMFGAMYGVNDRVTLMGMVPYIEKKMDHITFQGGAGTTRLGTFETSSDGIGDVSLTALIGLYDEKTPDRETHVNLVLGLSAPTGSITERGTVLAPNNTRPNVRLPYAMQLGSGTWDLLPGVTATKRVRNLSLGGQYARGCVWKTKTTRATPSATFTRPRSGRSTSGRHGSPHRCALRDAHKVPLTGVTRTSLRPCRQRTRTITVVNALTFWSA
ncbi:MAG: transporter [Hyphomicrobiaceae bacterium]|nr:transporter [Hyphomicrobiaceae bacterium]